MLAVAETPAPASRRSNRQVNLAAIPWSTPWALLDEHEAGAVLRVSVKLLRRQRCEGGGPRFLKMNGTQVRYRLADLQAFIEGQPTGGGAVAGDHRKRSVGRPAKTVGRLPRGE